MASKRAIFFMHKKAKTSFFRCWMKLFWHKEMQSISCARNPYGISLHPKNPLSKENSVKPAPLGAGRSFLWIFMIIALLILFIVLTQKTNYKSDTIDVSWELDEYAKLR